MKKPKYNPTEIDLNGTKYWKNENGQIHRLDGPAIEWADGHKEWFINGKRHRIDGPAVEYTNGTKEWCLNGEFHRLDGAAIEFANGIKKYIVKDLNVGGLNNFLYKICGG